MYGLASDTDLSFLIGQSVIQLCLGKYDIQLAFDDTTICIQGDISCKNEEGTVVDYSEFTPALAAALFSIIEIPVTRYVINPPGSLTLSFANAIEITMHDNTPQYEAYQIWGKGFSLIV